MKVDLKRKEQSDRADHKIHQRQDANHRIPSLGFGRIPPAQLSLSNVHDTQANVVMEVVDWGVLYSLRPLPGTYISLHLHIQLSPSSKAT